MYTLFANLASFFRLVRRLNGAGQARLPWSEGSCRSTATKLVGEHLRLFTNWPCRAGAFAPFPLVHLVRRCAADSMKWLFLLCAFLLPELTGCQPQGSVPQGIQVFFSPNGGATEAVVTAVARATNSVLVQAYSFTSAPIAEALVEAHRRGVSVRVILDHSQRTEKYSEADFLSHNGIPTLIDAQHSIAHNKIMILDDYGIVTGSFN